MAKIRLACAAISPRASPLMKRPFETAARKEKTHAQSVEPVADRWRSNAGRSGTRAVDVRRSCRHADGAAANAGRSPTATARLLSTARLSAPSLPAPICAGLSAAARGLRASASTPGLLCGCRAALRGMAGALLLRAGLLGRLRTALGVRPLGPLAPLKLIPLSLLACGLEKGVARGRWDASKVRLTGIKVYVWLSRFHLSAFIRENEHGELP
jgi:hypothetical protein